MGQRRDLRRRRAGPEDAWSRWVPKPKVAGTPRSRGDALRGSVTESWARSLTSVAPGRDSAPVAVAGGMDVDGVEQGASLLHSVVRAGHWNCAKNLQISALVQVVAPLSPVEPSTGPGA
jgi:hypothetical protein